MCCLMPWRRREYRLVAVISAAAVGPVVVATIGIRATRVRESRAVRYANRQKHDGREPDDYKFHGVCPRRITVPNGAHGAKCVNEEARCSARSITGCRSAGSFKLKSN